LILKLVSSGIDSDHLDEFCQKKYEFKKIEKELGFSF